MGFGVTWSSGKRDDGKMTFNGANPNDVVARGAVRLILQLLVRDFGRPHCLLEREASWKRERFAGAEAF